MKRLFNLYYKDMFLMPRLFIGLGCSAVLFLFAFFFPWLGMVPLLFFCIVSLLIMLDIWMLYRIRKGVFSRRYTAERFSNGDDNEVGIYIENLYSFPIKAGVIDEIPFQFQKRDLWFESVLVPGEHKLLDYVLRPVKRGEYEFGFLRLYIQSPLRFICRRYNFDQTQTVPVYPSFLMMRKYELMAISNRLSDVGIKKVRRVGNSLEFEQIKNYNTGDDFRLINWKATARQGNLMVNTYTDEKSQHVYCVIDKSRTMKMPFEGLSLLDYAINASLVLSSVALQKEDKAGLITISDKPGVTIAADRRRGQMNKIMEALYKEKTRYLETDLELLYMTIRKTIKQRSLVVFFTNFESLSGLARKMPLLKRIAKFHLLVIVFFENTELRDLAREKAENIEGIYVKTIAEKLVYEKKSIVKELARNGIQSILSSPKDLTVNTINRYLEIKAGHKI